MVDPVHLLTAFAVGSIPYFLLGFFAARNHVIRATLATMLVGITNLLAHQLIAQVGMWEISVFLLASLPGIAGGIGMSRWLARKSKVTRSAPRRGRVTA